MEKQSQSRFVQKELMKYAVSGRYSELKRVYVENNKNLGNFGGWRLLCDIVMYACQIMSIELLETIYEMDNKLDIAIKLDCDSNIFNNCILTNNMQFYLHLTSHAGPQYVLKRKINKLEVFANRNNCRKFIAIMKQSIICNDAFALTDNSAQTTKKYRHTALQMTKIEYIIVFASVVMLLSMAAIIIYETNCF